MAMIVTPGNSSNGATMAVKRPHAIAGIRVPEPDIVGAGKEPSLVRMPRQTLDMESGPSHYLQALPCTDLPESDGPVPATRQDSSLGRIENRMVDAIGVPLKSLQQLPA